MPEAEPVPLLQQRAFRMLSFTRFSSRLAQNSLNFGLVLLIADETGKAFFSGLLILALVVPSTVAGIVAGTAADHFPKRALVFLGDVARAAVCLLFIRGPGDVSSYYLVAVGLSLTGQFAAAGESVILPAVVTRAELARANAVSHAVGGAAQILGFGVLTPVVLRVFHNPDALFGIAAGLFALAAVQALLIGRVRSPIPREVGARLEGAWWQVGWRHIRADPLVFHATLELTLISTTLIILSGLVPQYIDDVLNLPIDIGALVLLPGAAGVALGLRTAGALAHRLPHALLSTVGFTTFVVLLAFLTFVNEEARFLGGYGVFGWLNDIHVGDFDGGGVVAMAIVLPLGFAYAIVAVSAQTVLNDRVPLQFQGRVLATQAALAAMASSLPVLAAGALSDVTGVQSVMAVVAGVTAAVAVANIRSPGVAPREPARAGR